MERINYMHSFFIFIKFKNPSYVLICNKIWFSRVFPPQNKLVEWIQLIVINLIYSSSEKLIWNVSTKSLWKTRTIFPT